MGKNRLHGAVQGRVHLLCLLAGLRTESEGRVDVRRVVLARNIGVLDVQSGELRLEVALEQLGGRRSNRLSICSLLGPAVFEHAQIEVGVGHIVKGGLDHIRGRFGIEDPEIATRHGLVSAKPNTDELVSALAAARKSAHDVGGLSGSSPAALNMLRLYRMPSV